MQNTESPRRIKTRHTPSGHIVELDHKSYADVLMALTIAIENCLDPEQRRTFQALRTSISQG